MVCLGLAAPPLTAGANDSGSAWSSGAEGARVDIGAPDLSPDVFGLEINMDFISAEEFECSDPANICDWATCDAAMYWCSDSTTSNVYAAVELPTGALITGHRAFQYIQALVSSGITPGCGNDNYCPDANVTRAQMAVFLAKALGLHWTY